MVNKRLRLALIIFASLTALFAIVFGILAGVAIASTWNEMSEENFRAFDPALPTRILDINGRLITEFVSNEKRELVSLTELPQHLIDAVIAREDHTFWTHPGFTFRGYMRAVWGKLTNRNLGGGSTITLQLAGTLFLNRKEITYTRKLRELWYGLQLERRFTKHEILEMYMNRMIMGPGVYGVEAASKYFFGHSAREITVAEAAVLVPMLSEPTKYNPIINPNTSRDGSRRVLDRMIELGYVSKEEADSSFTLYWDNYDYTRSSLGAYYMREDEAPWFSEYVHRQLTDILYGSIDLYKDGLTVHTTLNLDYQAAADRIMQRYLQQVNTEYQRASTKSWAEAERLYAPMAELFSLAFNLEDVFFQEKKLETQVLEYYKNSVNPLVDAYALMFGFSDLKQLTNASYSAVKTDTERNKVEGALITIDNETGYIMALVGGSEYSQSNQRIRATQGTLMPGSCFKPLYYSAAIDSRSITMGSLIYDAPVVFYNEDGTPYIPLNYKGEWKGQVLTWYALAKSMNIPSIKILDTIGFDAAINRSSALLGITDPATIRNTFPRVYPLALGIIGVTPLQMARAFGTFANQGREITTLAIRSIEDRDGRVILEPEKELRTQQKQKGSAIQVISPQNAFIMTKMLQEVVRDGTLAWPTRQGSLFTYKDENGRNFTIPSAGKTGTTQNWADAWTVGFTPHMTTAIWFGFDLPGNSLGVNQSGAAIAGTAWSSYMAEIHKGLPFKDFVRPQTGLVEVEVCSKSGLLPTEYCDEGTIALTYYEGTQPFKYCDLHQFKSEYAEETIRRLQTQGNNFAPVQIETNLNVDLSDMEALLLRLQNSTLVPSYPDIEAEDTESPVLQFEWSDTDTSIDSGINDASTSDSGQNPESSAGDETVTEEYSPSLLD
ncbi:MAG: PBP1A family penicillin-binding protein [Spirochaetes bacterium]|nr:PBP1A family penicillin-binding protein [Spirochaetota bacterium]